MALAPTGYMHNMDLFNAKKHYIHVSFIYSNVTKNVLFMIA